MIEFEDSQLRDLQEVDGIVLRDVHGEKIAIGQGFDYENIFEFVDDYFKSYGAKDFALKLGYQSVVDMFKHWFSGTPQTEADLLSYCMDPNAFDGRYASDLVDDYDYEQEAYLEAEDDKYCRLAGK